MITKLETAESSVGLEGKHKEAPFRIRLAQKLTSKSVIMPRPNCRGIGIGKALTIHPCYQSVLALSFGHSRVPKNEAITGETRCDGQDRKDGDLSGLAEARNDYTWLHSRLECSVACSIMSDSASASFTTTQKGTTALSCEHHSDQNA